MANIVLVGGHGKVALLATPKLIVTGNEVDAVIRNPEHTDALRAVGANPVVLSVEEASVEELTQAFAGADVVVWSAGAGGGNPERTYAVDRDAAIRSVDAANAAGVGQYIMVSWFGSRRDHGVPDDKLFWHYAEAKFAADEYVRAHAPGWTILGPSRLTLDEPTDSIEIDTLDKPVDSGTVSRADVASVIAQTVGEPGLAGHFIRFNTGATPIADALDSLEQ